jgi:ribosome-associated protein
MINIRERGLEAEARYSNSRSSGPGGQNVNKVNSKVEIRFAITSSTILSESEKATLLEKLFNRITIDGELVVVAQDDRSQLKNKQIATERFYCLIETALKPRKRRKKTHPTKKSIENRLKMKKIASEKKVQRRMPHLKDQ